MEVKSKKDILTGAAPLHCWDIFIYGYRRRLEFSGDLQRLQSIQKQFNWSEPPVSPGYALIWLNKVVIITGITLQIIHATENIYAMNGYESTEVIGNRPSMFQGRDSADVPRKIMRAGIDSRQPFETVITNYKKDGTPYECYIKGYPIFNKNGVLVNYMAFESNISTLRKL
ncbi:MAG TPA: PAS domain-containing protein [Chitinophagaceae bacterium]|nr:PAS domain-containing protein [Chitinophagaceae bacterium]